MLCWQVNKDSNRVKSFKVTRTMNPESDTDDIDESDGTDVDTPTEQELDEVIQRGMKAAAKGANVDHLLQVMTALFPANARAEITKTFSRALAQKRLQQLSSDPDIAPRSKLVRLHKMFEIIVQQQAIARVTALATKKPDIAAEVNRQGKKLADSGVKGGREHLTGADIGTISPSTAVKPERDRSSGRDV
jgi:hypothetical protein